MKNKIIILNHGLHISGVSRTLVSFANELAKNGYDVTVKIEINNFTLKEELDPRIKCSLFLREWRIFGIRIPGFLRFYNLFLRLLYKIPSKIAYKIIVNKKFDVEIAYNRGAAARIISASKNKNAKHLVWVHSDYMKNDNPLAGFKSFEEAKQGYSKFDKVVCVSSQAETSFKEKFGQNYPTVVKNNVIDTNRIYTLSETEKIEKRHFTIVAVGRLCEAKNYGLMLETASIIKERGYEVNFWIVGGGELENELIKEKDTLHLDNVHLLGAKVNPYPYIKSADLYVSSSIYEGLSTTTIEALILGKPCVVTDCAGMKEILGYNNEYGIVVPVNKISLADAIEKMIVDYDHRKCYSERALQRALFFEPSVTFNHIQELF